MGFLSEQDQQTLRSKFAEEMDKDVKLLLFTRTAPLLIVPGQEQNPQDYEYLRQARELMEEIAALSPKLSLEVCDVRTDAARAQEYHVDKLPAVLLESGETALRFFGLPAGYEFSTFIQDTLDLSRGDIQLSDEAQTYLRNLDHDVHLQVFVTPT